MKLPPSITRSNEEAITLKKRRIFAGGLIADDSWHVIGIQALETFDIFHSIVFVESNRTQNHTPRKWRFFSAEQNNDNDLTTEDFTLLTQRGIYGPNTHVHVEPFIYEQKKEPPMFREHLMRQKVLETWKKLGMTREDIGLLLDVDEIPSREFLKAAQICLPADEKLIQNNKFAVDWRTDDKQTCYNPLFRLSLTMFEGSPKCIHKEESDKVGPRFKNKIFKRFISTSMIIGACIEGIGNSTRHIKIPRINKDIYGNYQGGRIKGYGDKRDYSELIREMKSSDKTNEEKEFYYPLYNSADFRQMFKILTQPLWRFGASHGYHLHNFFDSADQIRFKYAHFGHVHDTAFSVPLGGLNADMSLFVKCAHNISDAGNRKKRISQTDLLLIVGGQKHMIEDHLEPLVFHALEGYADARHEEMVALLEKDEEIYGRADKFDGNHLYKDHMLTHPGKIYNTELKEEEKTK